MANIVEHILVVVFCCLVIENGLAQELLLGTPSIYQHSKKEYQAGSQNWEAIYEGNTIYFANNGGLLTYNGVDWKTHTTPNNTIMRSVCTTPSGKIYTGAQNEIGYFQHNANGILNYVNLKDSLHWETEEISEIWDIEIIDSQVYFTSGRYLHCYQKGKTNHFGHDAYISEMGKIQEQIWYHAEEKGVFRIVQGKEQAVQWSKGKTMLNVIAFVEAFDGAVFIITEKKGIFLFDDASNSIQQWKTNGDDFLMEKRISSATYDKRYGLFIGTYLGGLVTINSKGLVTALYNKKNGLQNNAVNCVMIAPNGTIWIGSNNGIDEIDATQSHFKFYPDNDLEGAVYDLDSWKGHLFFSTSNGLYYLEEKDYYNPLHENTFQLVPGTEGQTWGTDIIDGHLYCAHHEGPLQILPSFTPQALSDEGGAWKFVPLNADIVAVGHYYGVSLYKRQANGHLQFFRKVNNFEESARIMLLDQYDNLWISHPYKKVYKLTFNADYSQENIKVYSQADGFNSDDRNYVFNINQHCYLTNETGIYQYDQQQDQFVKDQVLNTYFQEGNHVRRLIQDQQDIWCISNDFTTRLRFNDQGLNDKIEAFQLKNLTTQETYIGGFEELFPLSDQRLIISTEAGALHYNYQDTETIPLEIAIKSIHLPIHNDSIIYGGFGPTPPIELDAQQNNIRFTYSNLIPSSNKSLNYSTRIQSLNTNWSTWQATNFKNYTNLPHGDHVLEVKAISNNGTESEVIEVPFTIATPWHKSNLAYLLYTLLFLGCLASIFWMLQARHRQNTKQLEQAKLEKEKELEHIKKEKLLNEIEFKNQELATSTLHLLQKNRTIETLKTKFDELNNHIKNHELRKELNNILTIFREDLRQEEDWEKFTKQFDQAHHDFITKLKTRHPNLTPNDHKICALLKMNLTTKEMAPLLNISIRGVEISRYRLRKKLEVDRSVNLNSYFNSEHFV